GGDEPAPEYRDRNRLPDGRPAASGDIVQAGQGNRLAGRRYFAFHHPCRCPGSRQSLQGKNIMADYLILDLKDGPVKIKLRSDLAPNHVERIKTLAASGFYDGVVFH